MGVDPVSPPRVSYSPGRPSSFAARRGHESAARCPAVFFDRDGVLNHALVRNGRPYPPRNLDELRIVDGAAEGLEALSAAGLRLLVVTNQPDVARGMLTARAAEAINAAVRKALPRLDDILVCCDDGESPRRKPNPGMLLEAAQRYAIDLRRSFMVGDRWKDIEAGRRAGCRTILIDHHYDEPWLGGAPDITVDSLSAAIAYILEAVAAPSGPARPGRRIHRRPA